MSRVFRATGTITAYFVTDETDVDKIEDIGLDVISDTIEFYGPEDAIEIKFERVTSVSGIPEDDRDSNVFVRSSAYIEDTDLTVEEAVENAEDD